jgi:hypothetical protein
MINLVFDQQVLAEEIEMIPVQASLVRRLQALTQLDIENLEAEPARRVAIGDRLGQPQPIAANLGMQARPNCFARTYLARVCNRRRRDRQHRNPSLCVRAG